MAFIQDYEQTVQASPTNRPQTFVNLSQNENGRQLIFHIIGVSIPAGSIATLSGTKPDGVVYSTTGTIEGDFVTVSEDMQMTAVAGVWDAKIHIVNGGNEIASALVRFVVEKDPVDAGAIPSDSQLDGIVAECQAYAEAARSSAYGSPLTASTAAAMTDQTRVYVYTGSETGYTAGHWYYYDGSAWTDGGAYNSAAIQTDPTLAIPGMAADSKAVGDAIAAEAAARAADIDDVKEDLTHTIDGLPSTEVYDSDDATDGYTLSPAGEAVTNASRFISDYMPVIGGIEYTYYSGATASANYVIICAYDADKNYISDSYAYQVFSYETPANAAFVRFSDYAQYKTAASFKNVRIVGVNEKIMGIESVISLNDIPNENTQPLFYDDDEAIYTNATVSSGTKSFNDDIITWTLPSAEEYAGNPQFVLFSAVTTAVPDYIQGDAVPDTLTFEFDYTTTADLYLYLYDKNNVMKYYQLPVGTDAHCKFMNTDVSSVKYIYFMSLSNANAGKTLSINNLKLYYGTEFGTNIHRFSAYVYDEIQKLDSAPNYKAILTIGDSLTNISGNAGTGIERWQNYVLKECNFGSFITEGAVGFTVAQLQGQSSIYDIVQALTRNNNVDFVTFWGGTNDWGVNVQIGDFEQNITQQDNTTFYGALISCIKKLLTLYPDKRIILIGTTPRVTNSTLGDFSTRGAVNQNGDTLIDFVDAVKKVAEYYSLPFVNLMNISGITDLNYETYLYEQSYAGQTYSYYLHFTEAGEIRIGHTLSGFIKSLL